MIFQLSLVIFLLWINGARICNAKFFFYQRIVICDYFIGHRGPFKDPKFDLGCNTFDSLPKPSDYFFHFSIASSLTYF